MARRRADRGEYWKTLVAEQERSGLSVRRYCEQAKVGEHSFYAWRARLRREPRLEFALVEPPRVLRSSAREIELQLSTGEQLRIPAGADAATLRMVLAALRA